MKMLASYSFGVSKGVYEHIVGPFGVAVIRVLRGQWANVVALSVVIPCDNLNKARRKGQDLGPSLVPKQVPGENPVLAIWDFL